MAITPKNAASQPPPPITDQHLKQQAQDLGRLGSLLGSKDNAPVYISGAIAIIGVLALIAIFFDPYADSATRIDFSKNISTIILSALTFLGGAASSKK